MREFVLQNDMLTVRVNSVGAELTGLYSKETGLEYMWQPGGETWPHSSLLLFPNAGRIAHDRYLLSVRTLWEEDLALIAQAVKEADR